MLASGLLSRHLPGLDPRDQLTLEFGFELPTNFSHYEYSAPQLRAERIGGREGLWKMPQLRKSTKVAFGDISLMISTSCLEKPPQKTLRLSHIYHSPDGYRPYSYGSRSLSQSACTKLGGKTLQSQGYTQDSFAVSICWKEPPLEHSLFYLWGCVGKGQNAQAPPPR